MKPAHPKRPARPLVVLGWDGASPELVEAWMAEGVLPNLSLLAARGGYAPLRSTLPPLSPAAWTTAFTGLNPGRHGVLDFGHRVAGTYRIEGTTARKRQGATLWEIASEAGLRSVVLNVPLSHPAPEVEGCVFVPGLGASSLDEGCWPSELGPLLQREVPGYRVDTNAYEFPDPQDFLDATLAMVQARTQVAEVLLRRERPDLFVGVFVAPDRVQHAFWKQSAFPWEDPIREEWRFSNAIKKVYRQLDEGLGRILHAAGPDATVLVLSDHGFGDLDGDLYLNTVLEEMGLLVVDRPELDLADSVDEAKRGGLSRLRALAAQLRVFATRSKPVVRDPAVATFGDIVWEESRAYSRGLLGNIWLNLRGREPLGQVEPGPEAEELMAKITASLLELRDPRDRRTPLIDAVLRGDQLFWGEASDEAPDLIVVPHEYRWMTRGGREIGPRGVLVGPPAVDHSGNHRMNGILVAGGPGVGPQDRLSVQRILDICPTALALLGVEVPRRLDGRPMEALLSCGLAYTEELPSRPSLGSEFDREGGQGLSAGAKAGGTEGSSQSEAKALEEQLRGLGYLSD